MKKKLCRVKDGKILGVCGGIADYLDGKILGVCGGIADYLDLDRTVVRLIVVLLMVFYGTGLLAYLIAALVMPKEE